MQIGATQWNRLKKEALAFGVPLPHGNKGKKRALDDEISGPIKEFWAGVESLSEIRATKTIRSVSGLETQGDSDGEVRLPQYFSLRNLYGRYLDELGYDFKQYGNVFYDVIFRNEDGATQKPYVQLSTFHNIWKKDFGHIKVSTRIEDICVMCYRFANRHKFMKKSAVNSAADASLFMDEADDEISDEVDSGDGGVNGSSHTTDDGESVEEEPTIESNQTQEESTFGEDTEDELGDIAGGGDAQCREKMIERAHRHVRMAQVQRLLYVSYVHKARQHVRLKIPFNRRSFTFVVDYGQNMELPVYNSEQPGCSYYYSPLGVYNLGMVDQAYAGPNDNENDNPRDHMHLHIYHEGVGKKGANNVCSLIWRTLKIKGLLKPGGETGGELNIIFDNCTGQNKNNTVLKLMVWLTEMGYFKTVNFIFIFLIVGHTKNAADRLFNLVKIQYRKRNLYTMKQLIAACDSSEHVSIHKASVNDLFMDWEVYLNHFYSDFSGKVKQNHIFSCDYGSSRVGNKLFAHLRESDLPEDVIVKHNTIKQTFLGRKLLFADKPFSDAVNARPQIMELAMNGSLKDGQETVGKLNVIENLGINIFKQVELAYKYKKIVPIEVQCDELFADPPKEVFEAVKKERASRKEARETINQDKQRVQKKLKADAKGEENK